jgi:hypothetical protein
LTFCATHSMNDNSFTTHLVANYKMSLATSDSIPNAEERKEKGEKNEREKGMRKRRRREVQTHGWKKEEERRKKKHRPTETHGWVLPAVGGTSGQPYSRWSWVSSGNF